jgi:hypothetical protein
MGKTTMNYHCRSERQRTRNGLVQQAHPRGAFLCSLSVAAIRVYDDIGNVIETHEHAGEFEEW